MKNFNYLILTIALNLLVVCTIKGQTNIAPLATPTHSGGGVTIYGPTNYNDLINIPFTFGWCAGTGGPNMWIQYEWTTPQTFNKITIFPDESTNRTLIAGDIQIWTGSTWITHTTFSVSPSLMFDVLFNPVTTTRVRIINMTIVGAQASNPSIREIQVYEAPANGLNDAGISKIIEPILGCVGIRPVKVELTNFGINQIDSVTILWSLNGIFQTPVKYIGTLDTANGTGPNKDTVTLGNTTFFNGSPRTIRAWTILPNNKIDTLNWNDTSQVTIMGRAYPVVDLGNDTSICPGNALTLSSGSGNDSTFWSTSASTPSISISTAGTYYVEVYKYGCNSSDTIVITTHPAAPPVNLGNDTIICYGTSITLNATAPGVIYKWNDNSNLPTKLIDTSGLFWVTLEDINFCKSHDSIIVGLIPEPFVSMNVSPSNTVCFGVPFTFTANPTTTGSIIYQWKINGINSGAQTTNNTFSPTLNSLDTVSVDLYTDVCSTVPFPVSSNDIMMTINPTPILINGLTADTVVENTKKNYAVGLIQGHGYLWRVSGGTILSDSTGFAIQVQWAGPNTNAWVKLIDRDASNCEYENILPVNIISVVGIDETNFELGDAYPNPANNQLNIPISFKNETDINLTIVDLRGREVKTIYRGLINGNKIFSVGTSDLNEGMYLYILKDSKGNSHIKKLIINH